MQFKKLALLNLFSAFYILLFFPSCSSLDLMPLQECDGFTECRNVYYTSDFKGSTKLMAGRVDLQVLGHSQKNEMSGPLQPKKLDGPNAIVFTFTNQTKAPLECYVSNFKIWSLAITNTYSEVYAADEEFEVVMKDRSPLRFQIIDIPAGNYSTRLKITFTAKGPAGTEDKAVYLGRVEKKLNLLEKFLIGRG